MVGRDGRPCAPPLEVEESKSGKILTPTGSKFCMHHICRIQKESLFEKPLSLSRGISSALYGREIDVLTNLLFSPWCVVPPPFLSLARVHFSHPHARRARVRSSAKHTSASRTCRLSFTVLASCAWSPLSLHPQPGPPRFPHVIAHR